MGILELFYNRIIAQKQQYKTVKDVAEARGLESVEEDGFLWYEVPEASGDSFIGGIMNRANAAWFKKYGDPEYVTVDYYKPIYNTIIREDYTDQSVINAIAGLEDHPVIDEELYSEMQWEEQERLFKDVLKNDFTSGLLNIMYDAKASQYESVENELENILTDDQLYYLFELMREDNDVEWIEENDGMYIDVDGVVKNINYDSLINYINKVKKTEENEQSEEQQTEKIETPQEQQIDLSNYQVLRNKRTGDIVYMSDTASDMAEAVYEAFMTGIVNSQNVMELDLSSFSPLAQQYISGELEDVEKGLARPGSTWASPESIAPFLRFPRIG